MLIVKMPLRTLSITNRLIVMCLLWTNWKLIGRIRILTFLMKKICRDVPIMCDVVVYSDLCML